MTIDSSAFERYRRSPNDKTTLFRLILGVIIIVVLWFGTTMAVIFAGSYGLLLQGQDDSSGGSDPIQRFLGSSSGIFATLVTFAGIWIGVWIAMRLLHKEKLPRLFGVSARISRSGFAKGFAAVAITSLLTEIAYLSVMPGIARGPIAIGTWALIFLPLAFFAFIQTSAEELLFRGYLQRGLAYLYRSPLVWGVLPTLIFTSLHWNPSSPLGMNIGVVIAIGAFSALLALLVYATGNLGAAMGAHLGNNLTGFALISHDQTLGGLALFQAPPLDSLAWTAGETALVAGISVFSIALTWLLLLHPRSPLRVRPDLG
ncbi:MAG: CPBP family intramembrane metalloprotease [Mesorhizobium sp.]|nr:CPBP family intramembrane glutamic endopeptidase [Mesorhizobium sp.]MBL8577632.1 CPBP family intramembrane metalloprotease [Mesorhizobium sp.]